jgi:large subunit ribosomal protein L17
MARPTATKLGRKKNPRNMLVRNMVTSLILHEQISTTRAKAKVLRSNFERLMTAVKRQKSSPRVAKSTLEAKLLDKNAIKKVFEVLLGEFSDKSSGYTRVIKLLPRKGDNAPMARVELIFTKKSVPTKTDKITEKLTAKSETKPVEKTVESSTTKKGVKTTVRKRMTKKA